MLTQTRRRIRALALLTVMALASALPATTFADSDTTPPAPAAGQHGVEFWDFDKIHQVIDLRLTFEDPESGVAAVLISCDGGPEMSYPYAAHVFVPASDPTAGGCAGYGSRSLQARAVNGDGLISFGYPTTVQVYPTFKLEFPLPARTGQPFTVHVHYSDGYTPPVDEICRWSLVWGSVASLRDNDSDESFGGMGLEGPASHGYCSDWTFTLPWVPIPRFQFDLSMLDASDVRTTIWPDRNLVTAQVVGTDRRIYQSTLPIAQILPSTYTPIVGHPVTYTRYLIGGATSNAGDTTWWRASLGPGENPVVWEKFSTASTFTITPPRPGNVYVDWGRERTMDLLTAYYDPPVRYRDATRPNTTAPVQKVGGAVVGPAIPVTLTWSGSDRGWGIKSFALQQSVNGGSWRTIALPTAKTTSIVRMVPIGTKVRYRVRATDKAGNVGSWDYGPTFRPRNVAESNPHITYKGAWPLVDDATAFGGQLREASVSGARATLTFTGRDVGWLAERGPGHGKAKVYVDGVLRATVDLNATTDSPRRVVYRRHWSSLGQHTIRVVVANSHTVGIDGFLVLK